MPRLHIRYRTSFVLWLVSLIVIVVLITGLGTYASLTAPLAILPMIFLLLLPAIFLARVPRSYLLQSRTMQAAARGDHTGAPLVIAPPNPNEALAAGATLQMSRSTAPGGVLRAGWGNVISAIVISAISEFLVVLAFPTLLNNLSSDTPVWVIWVFALVAPVMWLGLVIYQYFYLALQSRATISANDAGITLKQGLRQQRFIPWDDIQVWVRGTGNSSDPYLCSYALVGYRHHLFLQFNSPINLTSARANPLLAITYGGDMEAYEAQARQLLATIAARGKAPLCTFPQGFYGPSARRTLPFAQLTTSDIAALPVAHPALLPSWPAVQAMQQHPGPLVLRQRTRVPISSFVALGLVVAILVLLSIVNTYAVIATGADPLIAGINFFPLIVIVVLLLLVFVGRSNTTITVDAQGIRGAVLNRQRLIPWQKVRYWAIEPPSIIHPHEIIYGIFSDGPTLTWRVPVSMNNDPRSMAQRAYNEAFHAMIAARAGQPPRQLPVQPPPTPVR